jgi:hypothetical protein
MSASAARRKPEILSLPMVARCWFSALTTKRIRRGSFGSVPELVAAIREYIHVNNKSPEPFVWSASVQSILEKLQRCRAISRTDD